MENYKIELTSVANALVSVCWWHVVLRRTLPWRPTLADEISSCDCDNSNRLRMFYRKTGTYTVGDRYEGLNDSKSETKRLANSTRILHGKYGLHTFNALERLYSFPQY